MKGDLGSGMKNIDMAIKLDSKSKQMIISDPVFKKLQSLEGFQNLMN
jgi:hypothetical protein